MILKEIKKTNKKILIVLKRYLNKLKEIEYYIIFNLFLTK